MKPLVVAVLTLLVLPVYAHAQEERRDGNWWVGETPNTKLNYAVGFFDGMELGHDFSYWGIVKDPKKEKCLVDVRTSFDDSSAKFFSHVSNYQLVDGLDTFYKDYRNRKIRAPDAVWIVVNEIAGTPQSEVDKMIEGWRQNSSKP
jgi:hypothetical protein